jgi:serine/threonine-protein kinase
MICLGSTTKTEISTESLEPQPDGTYRGTETWTIQTNECRMQGNVYVLPLVAWRTGPAPPGVVADPNAVRPPADGNIHTADGRANAINHL